MAPVLVPVGGNKGYVPWLEGGGESTEAPVRLITSGDHAVGLCFNLAQPDKKIVVGDDIDFGDEPLPKLLQRRFKAPVGAVAFGGTHRPIELRHEGVLFFNPGSPNLPMEGSPGAVAVLDLAGDAPRVDLVTIGPAG